MQELLIDELKDLYSAEKQIVRALPKLAKAPTSADLKQALTKHLQESEGQVERLERIAEMVGKKLTGKTCAGMKGVLEEGSEVLEDTEKGTVRDAMPADQRNGLAVRRLIESYRRRAGWLDRRIELELQQSDPAQPEQNARFDRLNSQA